MHQFSNFSQSLLLSSDFVHVHTGVALIYLEPLWTGGQDSELSPGVVADWDEGASPQIPASENAQRRGRALELQ